MEKLLTKLKKIKPATYIRTAALIIALANQACNELGLIHLPNESQGLYDNMSLIFTTLTGIVTWWKNNSFTDAAIKADEVLKELRENEEDNVKGDGPYG